jgi:hypothetical protein
MEQVRIQELVARYRTQALTSAEELELEGLIEKGLVEIDDLGDMGSFNEQVMRLATPAPGPALDDRFYAMLRQEKKSLSRRASFFSWRAFFVEPSFAGRFAMAAVILVLGIGIGYWVRPAAPGESVESADMAQLTREVTDLKEMMMLSLLEKESATDRLKAVSLTEDMDQASQKVTRALVETLNNDSNVNVRLAALEALAPYAQAPHVREALVRSIARQDSPLVQVALAELMAGLQVKSSVKEFQKILKDERTPADIKHKIQQSIDIII